MARQAGITAHRPAFDDTGPTTVMGDVNGRTSSPGGRVGMGDREIGVRADFTGRNVRPLPPKREKWQEGRDTGKSGENRLETSVAG